MSKRYWCEKCGELADSRNPFPWIPGGEARAHRAGCPGGRVIPIATICDPPEPTVIDESDLAPGMAGARCIFGGRAGGCGAGTMTPRDELKAGLWVWRGDWVIGREPPRTDRLVAIHKSGDSIAQVKIIDDNLDAAIDQMLERFT